MASAASVSAARPPLGLALAAVLIGAAASAALLYWALPDPRVAAALFAGALAVGIPLVLTGRRGRAGLMAALADPEGALIAANRAFLVRALGETKDAGGAPLADLIGVGEDNRFHFVREGKEGGALRIVQVPVGEADAPILFLLLD